MFRKSCLCLLGISMAMGAQKKITIFACGDALSDDTRAVIRKAGEDASAFSERYLQTPMTWAEGCAVPRGVSNGFVVRTWEKVSKKYAREHKTLFISISDNMIVVRYDLAKRLARKHNYPIEKIVGMGIATILVMYLSGEPGLNWYNDDFRFLKADLPQGFTNEILEKARAALVAAQGP